MSTVLNGLKNRGEQDNLNGFSSAIQAVFPQRDLQNCIIYQLRNFGKYVSYKDN